LRLLLDTHILLWVMLGAPQLPRLAQQQIDAADAVFVSSVSLWEASIKVALGKLKIDMDRLEDLLRQSAFTPLPVSWAHARALRQLPLLHADPFDRMLVAQASHEPLILLTHDAALAAYGPLVSVV
jgi:PIN domain nuclease of toxin-antitoxin system